MQCTWGPILSRPSPTRPLIATARRVFGPPHHGANALHATAPCTCQHSPPHTRRTIAHGAGTARVHPACNAARVCHQAQTINAVQCSLNINASSLAGIQTTGNMMRGGIRNTQYSGGKPRLKEWWTCSKCAANTRAHPSLEIPGHRPAMAHRTPLPLLTPVAVPRAAPRRSQSAGARTARFATTPTTAHRA